MTYFYVSPLKNAPWFIAAIVPEDEILAGVNHTRNLIVALVLVAFFLEILALYWVTKKLITSPLDSVLSGIKKLHSGEPNPNISIQGKDEFSEVALSFNEMSDQLQSSRQKLVESTSMLESIINTSDAVIYIKDVDGNYRQLP